MYMRVPNFVRVRLRERERVTLIDSETGNLENGVLKEDALTQKMKKA